MLKFKLTKLGTIWTYSYTGSFQTFPVSRTGEYQIELWGAQGGSGTDYYSYGGYTSGQIYLTQGQTFHIYVGQNNTINDSVSFNGGEGSLGGMPGGGATDIRTVNGNWNNFESLKSRIMVAAGGGTGAYNSGYGGGLSGGNSMVNVSSGGTGGNQTSPGVSNHYCESIHASFGIGGNCGGGGGGYYGGSGSAYEWGGGSGGSSFISGHPGCNAISSSSTENNIIHTNQPNHYSGYVFTNTKMIAGNASMPTHDGSFTMIGNSGHGYARIILINPKS